MNEYLQHLLTKYKKKGIILDTNVLLLYLVGTFDLNLIKKFSRTADFSEEDFNLVSTFINLFSIKITTPHILTEVSNLFGNKKELHETIRNYLTLAEEKFSESKDVTQNTVFVELGLTDTAIIETAQNSYLVFTDDNPLYHFLINSNIDAVNLDQIRMI